MTNNKNGFTRLQKRVARNCLVPLCAALGVLGSGVPASAGAVYTTFDPQGSVRTQAWCMNDGGAIAGNYFDSNNMSHGFVRAVDGTITAFDPAGSIKTQVGYDQCINAKGWTTGSYLDAGHVSHGYVRAPDGSITSFDPAGSTYTSAYGINSSRTVVGSYTDASGFQHAFFRTADGTITPFDPPGSAGWAVASQINRDGEIAGEYYDANGTPYVFVRSADGKYISSNLGASWEWIYASGINDDGVVTGWTSTTCIHLDQCSPSFVWAPDRSYTFYTFFYALVRRNEGAFSLATCINEKGLIAGYYSAYDVPPRGFTRSADGTIQRFDPPGSTGTYVQACDSRGDVTGYYFDSSKVSHGFLRSR